MDKITSLNSLWRKIDNSLKSDYEIVLEAAKWDALAALDFADESLKNDHVFIKEVEQYLSKNNKNQEPFFYKSFISE